MPFKHAPSKRGSQGTPPSQLERGPAVWVPHHDHDEDPLPHIHFRTLNGYRFWPVDLPEGVLETESLRIRRGFEVRGPDGESMRVAVDVTTAVRGFLREAIGRDVPPEDPMWDYVCRSALCEHLRTSSALPAGGLLIYGLTRDQIVAACCMAR